MTDINKNYGVVSYWDEECRHFQVTYESCIAVKTNNKGNNKKKGNKHLIAKLYFQKCDHELATLQIYLQLNSSIDRWL